MHHYARCHLNIVYAHAVNRHETGKNVVCLPSDTINSADAPYINRIMLTLPNVTANGTYYIEQVNCKEGTHELVYVALTLLITSLSALLTSYLQLRRRRRSTAASTERVLTPTTTV